MIFRSANWALAVVVAGACSIYAQPQATGRDGALRRPTDNTGEPQSLLAELSCVSCHADLKTPSTLRDRTPDLSSAGLRYNPAYLFDYLQNPIRVKEHLGRSRMPDFHLSEKEALALVLFLQTQKQVGGPELPSAIQSSLEPAKAATTNASRTDFEHELQNGLICLTCHRFEGKGGAQGVELANISFRLQRDWVKTYLVAPSRFGVPPTNMPPQFFQISADGAHFQELTPQALRKVNIVADYLFSLNGEKRKALEERFRAAQASFPNVTAELGRNIFQALNCAGCHRSPIQPRAVGPPLAQESQRVNLPWLENYLRHSVPIRPFGFHPGEGSRMPDFRLSDEETRTLTRLLFTEAGSESSKTNRLTTDAGPLHAVGKGKSFEPRPLSAFASHKAELLLNEKLSCLGCHRFGEKGGRIAPDLAAIRARLQPDYAFQMIKDPRAQNPQTIMPKIPMPAETLELIASFLLQQDAPAKELKYLSLTDNTLIVPDIESGAGIPRSNTRSQYITHCAICHGQEGRGDGFNAQFLNPKPTLHADAKYMAARPDDSLFDAISSGGYIMNRSRFMPPWGQTFSPLEISALVASTRVLCQCQGPAWSRDNAKGP